MSPDRSVHDVLSGTHPTAQAAQGSAADAGGVAMRSKFTWAKVSERVLRELLRAAPGRLPETFNPDKESADHLRLFTASVYGTQPQFKKLDTYEAWGVLRDVWAFKEAKKSDLAALAIAVSRGLSVQERQKTSTSQAALRTFIHERSLVLNFKKNLLKAFLQAHKVQQPVRSHLRTQGRLPSLSGPIQLSGEGSVRTNTVFAHHLEARSALDLLSDATSPVKRRGLIVLPTGAGKTSTAVDWIVPRLAKDAGMRVLWLAHQHELLEQAADSFWKASLREPSGFSRRMRVISSNGSAPSTLAESNLDLALITWQSLHSGWDEKQKARLKTFLSRPCVVVVDEAHHAAAPAYQKLLRTITAAHDVVVIGLTATPWPSGDGAAGRLCATFPERVIFRSVEEMHAAGILATPVLHVVDTNEHIKLTEPELKAAGKADLPPDVLKRLASSGRTALLVRTWLRSPDVWSKTLVFAVTQQHADLIGKAFHERAVPVKVLHGNSSEDRGDILAWFRKTKEPCVLVSVGMLTEGVDLPDAKTAFLARPTTSRILLRQMIGRVLRGPQSGGEETAHVVYLRDHWLNFEDTIEPSDLRGIGGVTTAKTDDGAASLKRLPPILDENTGLAVAEDLLEQVRRMYLHRLNRLPLDPATSHTELVGYYRLEDQDVPVMAHQRDGYQKIIDRSLLGTSFQGSPARAVFDDTHPPYPTARAVDAVFDYVRSMGQSPPFIDMSATISPVATAREFRGAGAMTDQERETWLRGKYDASLARLAYETFESFEEAVDRELRELRFSDRNPGHRRANPEHVLAARGTTIGTKVMASTSRLLPSIAGVTNRMWVYLAGEPVLDRLDIVGLSLKWTNNPVTSTWAHWSLTTSGKGAGNRSIRINKALRVSPKHISDELLSYLIFHELLHDLLPRQGHDSEFRRLESLWPDCDQLDIALDTMSERLQLPGQSNSGRRLTT